MSMSSTGTSSRYLVGPEESGQRLDKYLTLKADITRSQLKLLIDNGLVLVNAAAAKTNYKVRSGDEVVVNVPAVETETLVPEDIPLNIMYSDEHLAVIDKPAGLVVYPAAGHSHDTMMNALAHRFERLCPIGAPMRPGVVHRLDKETSGVMVVALSEKAYYSLVEQFGQKSTTRRYRALIYGNPKNDEGEVNAKIGRAVSDRKKMSTKTRHGKEAMTRWRVLKRFGEASLVEAILGTGRTHQIRVHMAFIGHPVLGDKTYGRKTVLQLKGRKVSFHRQMLHAELLGFTHPETGQWMEFTSEMPEDMKEAVEILSEKD